MKKLLVLLAVAGSTIACGNVKKHIKDLQSSRDEQAQQIQDLQNQINAQNSQITTLIKTIEVLQESLIGLQLTVDALPNGLDYTQLQNAIAATEQNVAALQTTVNLSLVQLATLSQNVQILNIVDPCGDGPGFDEVLLQTSSGYLAYFEVGNNRFLSTLTDGNYRTTDQQACNFSIVNGVLQ